MIERARRTSVRGAKSAKRQTVPIEHRALPTPERMRRAGADFQRGDSGQITLADNPFDRAVARGHISREQFSAGQKFRHHWYYAGLSGQLASIDSTACSRPTLPPSPPWRGAKAKSSIASVTAKPCRRSARSDRTFWTR
jgi:hypothetical protein